MPDRVALDAKRRSRPKRPTPAKRTGRSLTSAHRAHPDLQKDPIWTKTDEVLDNPDVFAKTFADCTATTVFMDDEFEARLPDYKTCSRAEPAVRLYRDAELRRFRHGRGEARHGGQARRVFRFDLKNGTGTWWTYRRGRQRSEARLCKICDGSAPYRFAMSRPWLADFGL